MNSGIQIKLRMSQLLANQQLNPDAVNQFVTDMEQQSEKLYEQQAQAKKSQL